MNKLLRAFLLVLSSSSLLLLCPDARAHVGSPNLFYEGTAAGVPIRVIIKPPGVIPGLAEVTVRTSGRAVEKMTVLPVYGETGRKGSPTPDEMKLVRGETNLYSGSLWLMKRGAYSVHVNVKTAEQTGEVVVPVNSLATVRSGMPPALGTILGVLGVLLFTSLATIIGAAATESTLPPAEKLSSSLRQRRILWTGGAALFLAGAVAFGKSWWSLEDRLYSEKRISRAWPSEGRVKIEDGRPVLTFSFSVPDGQNREWSPLILDHGKWSHFFLIRKETHDVLVHLHPKKLAERRFSAVLPPVPAGRYDLYADISHESGLYRTLHTEVTVPTAPEEWTKRWTSLRRTATDALCGGTFPTAQTNGVTGDLDGDDTWHIDSAPPSPSADEVTLMGGLKVKWIRPPALVANRDTSLRFELRDFAGKPAALETYLGMGGHLILRREDGSVFVHMHPSGNISMASQAVLAARSENPDATEIQLLAATTNYLHQPLPGQTANEISFPYAFPKAGNYRLWVQFKHRGQVLTASYLAEVSDK